MTLEQIDNFKSDFKVIAEYFHALANKEDYHPSDKKLDHPEEVIDMISVLSGDERFREEYNSIINNNQGGVTMCEIYDKIEQKGYNKGVVEGRVEGRAEGEAKGFLKALVGLVKDKILTMSEAASRANMTVEEFEKQYAIYA